MLGYYWILGLCGPVNSSWADHSRPLAFCSLICTKPETRAAKRLNLFGFFLAEPTGCKEYDDDMIYLHCVCYVDQCWFWPLPPYELQAYWQTQFVVSNLPTTVFRLIDKKPNENHNHEEGHTGTVTAGNPRKFPAIWYRTNAAETMTNWSSSNKILCLFN